ncbi:MAG TPA: hypothetical protein VGF29_15065, partial [Hyphomicrobiaceae bacterium]
MTTAGTGRGKMNGRRCRVVCWLGRRAPCSPPGAEHAVQVKLIFVNRFFHPDHSATSQMLSDLAFALA